jgi:hypothetical protein
LRFHRRFADVKIGKGIAMHSLKRINLKCALLLIVIAALLAYHARLAMWLSEGCPGARSPQWIREVVNSPMWDRSR